MTTMDIFSNDAFSTFELTAALNRVPYVPDWLGSLGIFQDVPVRTETVAVEKRENRLRIVQTTPRGAPLPRASHGKRNLRDFRTVRIAEGDQIRASEIQSIRAFGSETELLQVQEEVLTRLNNLRANSQVTHENMRLGAIFGRVIDADGSVINDWFDEWGIARPEEIEFKLGSGQTSLRTQCNQISRQMARASKGSFTNGTRVYALAGDEFWDKFTTSKEVERTYLNQVAAAELREGNAFGTFDFGNITWVNYRGTDEGEVGVAPSKVKFFPVGAKGVFQRALSPGESFDFANTKGQESYALIVPDKDRNQFVEVEMYSYPLYMCTQPEVLLDGTL